MSTEVVGLASEPVNP